MSNRLKEFLSSDIKATHGVRDVFDMAVNNIAAQGPEDRVLAQSPVAPLEKTL